MTSSQKILDFICGIAVGAASWASSAIFGSFEPFDSAIALLVNQFLLIFVAAIIGYKKQLPNFFLAIIGMYIGLNSYAYIFGTSETRAWYVLGLVTTLSLIILPLITGLITNRITKKTKP